jgi:ABC1 atypical kinase-like domain
MNSWQRNTKLIGAGLGAGLLRAVSADASRRFLRERLADLPGLPAKAAQQMGILLGEAAPTAAQAPRLSRMEALALVEAGSPALAAEIAEFSDHCQAASLGQVHRARLKDGRVLAVKVQYPGLAVELESQLDLLLSATRFGPSGLAAFDRATYRKFFLEELQAELDYVSEARRQATFRSRFGPGNRHIRIPAVYSDFSGPAVLAQEFVETIEISGAASAHRSRAAAGMAILTLTGIFGHGDVHTDLHPGNWGIDASGLLVLFDFGSTVSLRAEEVLAFRALYDLAAAESRDAEAIASGLGRVGFTRERLLPMQRQLPSLLPLLFEPVLQRDFRASHWRFSDRAAQILGDNRWAFRAAGAPWFFQLMRSVGGVMHAFQILQENPPLATLLPVAIEAFQPQQAQAPQSARHLRVLVREKGESVADISMPARAVEDLENLVPEAAHIAINNQGRSIREIQDTILQNGICPQLVFEFREGARDYKVWLE